MSAIAVPQASAAPGFVDRLKARSLALTRAMVADWGATVSGLTDWEDENLLDVRTPELLAKHKASVDWLISFGEMLSVGTEQEDFPDAALRAEVRATLDDLRDRLAMWHRPRMPREAADKILAPAR